MSERKFSVNLKTGPGYEAALICVGGDSVSDLEAGLDAIATSLVLQKAVAISVDLQADYRDAKTGSSQSQGGPSAPIAPRSQNQQNTGYAPPPAGAAPMGAPQQQAGYFSDGTPVPEDPWAASPAPADPWASAPPQHQQRPAAPPRAANPNAPHCQCGEVMEFKQDSGPKGAWKCRHWRYNNGNITPDHDRIPVK